MSDILEGEVELVLSGNWTRITIVVLLPLTGARAAFTSCLVDIG